MFFKFKILLKSGNIVQTKPVHWAARKPGCPRTWRWFRCRWRSGCKRQQKLSISHLMLKWFETSKYGFLFTYVSMVLNHQLTHRWFAQVQSSRGSSNFADVRLLHVHLIGPVLHIPGTSIRMFCRPGKLNENSLIYDMNSLWSWMFDQWMWSLCPRHNNISGWISGTQSNECVWDRIYEMLYTPATQVLFFYMVKVLNVPI